MPLDSLFPKNYSRKSWERLWLLAMLKTASHSCKRLRGGMRAISDMLLRMRELAVQSGNGTYTTSDRAELQKEMNQLKNEINRISGATEFNTKKLLNGNATALWSSSTDKVNLIINSNVRAGDYRLDISTAVGRSAQYSSHIMRLKGGEFAASVTGDKENIAYVGTLEGQTFGTKGDFYNIHVTDDSGIKDTYEQIITTALETFLISAVATYLKNEVSNDMKKLPGIKIGEFAKGTANGDLNSIFGTITIPQIQNNNNFDVDFKLESGTAFAAGKAGISGNIALTSKTLVRIQGDTSGSNLADGGGVIVINSDGGEHSQIGGGTIAVKYDPGELTKKNNYDGLEDLSKVMVHFTTGTLQLRTALLGSSSTLAIVGSDEIVNAFGFDKSIKELNSVVSIITSDMRTGNIIAQETLASAYLSNSIQGTTIEVLNAGVTATANNGNIAFKGGNTVAFIHLTDKSTNMQIGGNAGQQIGISIKQLDGAGLGINDAYVYSQKEAQIALSKIDSALTKMGSSRATVGAQMNRLQYTTVNLDTMRENLIFAHSRIVDADIAAETTLLIRNQVLRDAATAMLVQANMLPQSSLSLLLNLSPS